MEQLADLDQTIDGLGRHSLSPDRERASTLVALCQGCPDPVVAAVGTIATAHVENFPETIFWDYDHLVSFLSRTDRPPADVAQDMVALFEQFGRHSIIAFRYVHDFFFGFDWIKWVHKSPTERLHTHPFDKAALNYLAVRGHEIEDLIAQNDTKYPKLPSGHPRNAYGFARDLEEEKMLFERMAADDLIPLRMWEADTTLHPERDYLDERESLAASLGLSRS